MTPSEIRELRLAVQCGGIAADAAHATVVASRAGGKHWRSPAWILLREQLIGEHCTQCGSSDNPLTLQHLWQPPRFHEVHGAQCEKHWSSAWLAWRAEHPLEAATEERYVCPRCRSSAIYERKRLHPRWMCNGKLGRRVCGHAFDEPGRDALPARRKNAAENAARWQQFQEARARDVAAMARVFRDAVLVELQHFERYMSGCDTTTFCKRCAFLWDKKRMRRCAECQTRWHSLDASACSECGGRR